MSDSPRTFHEGAEEGHDVASLVGAIVSDGAQRSISDFAASRIQRVMLLRGIVKRRRPADSTATAQPATQPRDDPVPNTTALGAEADDNGADAAVRNDVPNDSLALMADCGRAPHTAETDDGNDVPVILSPDDGDGGIDVDADDDAIDGWFGDQNDATTPAVQSPAHGPSSSSCDDTVGSHVAPTEAESMLSLEPSPVRSRAHATTIDASVLLVQCALAAHHSHAAVVVRRAERAALVLQCVSRARDAAADAQHRSAAEERRRHAYAARIQALHRGNSSRALAADLRVQRAARFVGLLVLQRIARGYRSRRAVALLRRELAATVATNTVAAAYAPCSVGAPDADELRAVDHAAVRIQCCCRRLLARLLAGRRRASRDVCAAVLEVVCPTGAPLKHHASATRIQAVFRGRQARTAVAGARERDAACMVLQRTGRGFVARSVPGAAFARLAHAKAVLRGVCRGYTTRRAVGKVCRTHVDPIDVQPVVLASPPVQRHAPIASCMASKRSKSVKSV